MSHFGCCLILGVSTCTVELAFAQLQGDLRQIRGRGGLSDGSPGGSPVQLSVQRIAAVQLGGMLRRRKNGKCPCG